MTQSEFEASLADNLADIGFCLKDGNGNPKPVSRRDAKDMLDILGSVIHVGLDEAMPSVKAMQDGAKPPSITVRGVGRFVVRFRKARPKRMGRNPATGEPIEIAAKPASRKLVLTPPRQLKEDLGVE
jgi:nucleoid DNA-binding protein